MTNFQDCSIGYGVEGTFRTFQTPTRWVEFTKESFGWDKGVKQGKGMRVGARVARSGRRVIPTAEGKGALELEVASKGLGSLWQSAVGTSTSTLVSGTTYQQNHTLGDTLPSLTVQKGVPRVNGTVDAYSFLGCTVGDFEIDSAEEDILMAKFNFDVADVTTAQGYTAPSYPAAPVDLIHWGQGVAQVGGGITAPGTNTLALMASPLTVNISKFNLTVNNSLNGKRWNYGNGGRKSQQIVGGYREIKGKFTAEYDQTTLRDAFLNDTDVPILITFTGPALSTGNVTFQVVLPTTRLDSDLPEANDGDLISIDHSFTVLDGLSQSPMTIVTRTADTAL